MMLSQRCSWSPVWIQAYWRSSIMGYSSCVYLIVQGLKFFFDFAGEKPPPPKEVKGNQTPPYFVVTQLPCSYYAVITQLPAYRVPHYCTTANTHRWHTADRIFVMYITLRTLQNAILVHRILVVMSPNAPLYNRHISYPALYANIYTRVTKQVTQL